MTLNGVIKLLRRFGNTAFFRVARKKTSPLFVVVCHFENVFKMFLRHVPKNCMYMCVIYMNEKSRFIHTGEYGMSTTFKSNAFFIPFYNSHVFTKGKVC